MEEARQERDWQTRAAAVGVSLTGSFPFATAELEVQLSLPTPPLCHCLMLASVSTGGLSPRGHVTDGDQLPDRAREGDALCLTLIESTLYAACDDY